MVSIFFGASLFKKLLWVKGVNLQRIHFHFFCYDMLSLGLGFFPIATSNLKDIVEPLYNAVSRFKDNIFQVLCIIKINEF